ncbi:hypothetical protein [Bradyrhizobium tropiciagri]|uniref:hypothetical protein n=1 Tax=Bradyrhizobium tropiciagri TaxID=312253 RepID=UPI00067DB53A|nr:hypothetical protein [Bradyrhizobium tropiciagri]
MKEIVSLRLTESALASIPNRPDGTRGGLTLSCSGINIHDISTDHPESIELLLDRADADKYFLNNGWTIAIRRDVPESEAEALSLGMPAEAAKLFAK